MTSHDVGCRIADEQDINACGVKDLCQRKVVSRQHTDLFATLFHFLQGMCGNFFLFGFCS
jgi:hypothetical protein